MNPQNTPKQPGGLKAFTARWNEMVTEAIKLGIQGVKTHTSDFESYTKAEKRVAWLEAQVAERQAKAAAKAEEADVAQAAEEAEDSAAVTKKAIAKAAKAAKASKPRSARKRKVAA